MTEQKEDEHPQRDSALLDYQPGMRPGQGAGNALLGCALSIFGFVMGFFAYGFCVFYYLVGTKMSPSRFGVAAVSGAIALCGVAAYVYGRQRGLKGTMLPGLILGMVTAALIVGGCFAMSS